MQEITDTGIKGFLKWFAAAQPGLYKKIAPQIAAKVPAAFTDYHQGMWRVAGLTNSEAVKKLNGFGLFEDSVNTITSDVTPTMTSLAFNTNSVAPPAAVDVSTAANTGSASTGTTDLISSIVGGISSLYMAKQQANIQQQVVNTQLQRAALGLPPLPTSLSNLGVPQVSVGLSSGLGGGLAIGAAVLLGVALLSGIGKRSRA